MIIAASRRCFQNVVAKTKEDSYTVPSIYVREASTQCRDIVKVRAQKRERSFRTITFVRCPNNKRANISICAATGFQRRSTVGCEGEVGSRSQTQEDGERCVIRQVEEGRDEKTFFAAIT